MRLGRTVSHPIFGEESQMTKVFIPLVAFLVYFLPTLIAMWRDHSGYGRIAVVNLLLGVTVIGWVVALADALSNNMRRLVDETELPMGKQPAAPAMAAMQPPRAQ